ncbi:hypothetical protein P5V15_008175 [Pogonomyrmex californicus]
MICIDSLHVSLNRFLLLIFGLWPYQQSVLVRLQLTILFSILTTFIIFQFTIFVTLKCTPDLLINVLSSAFYTIFFMIKYISFSINTEIVKYLLDQLQHIRNELTDEGEISIIRKYGRYAKRYTIAFLSFAVLVVLASFMFSFWPHIFDVLFFINRTQSNHLFLFKTEYFIDQERYFYLITLHANMASIIGIGVVMATGTLFIFYQQHACGMFQIASYRIKQAMIFKTLRNNNLQNKYLIYKKLIYAVDMHCKAMRFSELIISRFKVMFCVLIIFAVLCGSINIFWASISIIQYIFQTMSSEYEIAELLFHFMIIIIEIVYILTANYLAQEIIDHNNNIYVTVYNIQWYITPLQIQKMVLFLLQRRTKEFNLNIAGLFVGSLEGAATVRNIYILRHGLNIIYFKQIK